MYFAHTCTASANTTYIKFSSGHGEQVIDIRSGGDIEVVPVYPYLTTQHRCRQKSINIQIDVEARATVVAVHLGKRGKTS